ncbi:MAG: hypothetical protein ACP5IL_08840 [Syntrophobacteraceae bacterium]
MESLAHRCEIFPGVGVASPPEGGWDTELLQAALELLDALRAEEQILKKFSATELLALLPKKEYLVSEFGWKLRSAMDANTESFSVSDALKPLLAEICRLNASNGVFLKRSLSYWRDLQAILLPQGYSRNGRKDSDGVRPPNGITFAREV